MRASLAGRALVALALVVPSCFADLYAPLSGTEPAWFCHGLDCPVFEVLNVTDAYEVRDYEAGVWASTKVESYAYAVALPLGFRRLFKYIDGGNEGGVKIPMTTPVRVDLEPSCGPFCKQNFTVSFFVPFDFQEDPPKPSEPDVYIESSKRFTAYVAQSGGFLIDDFSVARMAKALSEALDAEGVEYEDEHFYTAGYDPPFRLQGRHNEVWFVASEDEDSATVAEQ